MDKRICREIVVKNVPKGLLTKCVIGWFKDGLPLQNYLAHGSFSDEPPEQHLFEIGSITKTFTASLVSQLEIDGLIDLDESVGDYLPLSSNSSVSPLSLRSLLTHYSGLPSVPKPLLKNCDRENPYHHINPQMLLDIISNYHHELKVGKSFSYSNLGYGILGQIIESVTSKGYEHILIEKVLAPLGMQNTWTNQCRNPDLPKVQGTYKGKKVVPYWTFDAMQSTGAIVSNAHDMLTYARANLNTHSFYPSIEMCHSPLKQLDKQNFVGLAWMISVDKKLGAVHYHNGGTGGFNSFLAIHPKTQSGVVVFINSQIPLIQQLGLQQDMATRVGYRVLRELLSN